MFPPLTLSSAHQVADLTVAAAVATPVATTTAPTAVLVAVVPPAPRPNLEGRQGGGRRWRDRLAGWLARAREAGNRLEAWGDFGRQKGEAAVQAANGFVSGVSRRLVSPPVAGGFGARWRERLEGWLARAGEAGLRLAGWGDFGRQRGEAAVQAVKELVAGVSRRGLSVPRQLGKWRGRLDGWLARAREAGNRLRNWGDFGHQRGEAAVQAANEIAAGVSRRQMSKWRERLDGWLSRAREAGNRLRNWGDFGRNRGEAAVQAANEIVAGVSHPRRAVPVLAARDWRQDLSAAKSLASSVVSSARDTASTAAVAADSSNTTTTTRRADGDCGPSDQPRTSTVTVSLVLAPSLTTLRQPAAQTVLPPAVHASAAHDLAPPSAATIVLASVGIAVFLLCKFQLPSAVPSLYLPPANSFPGVIGLMTAGMTRSVGRRGIVEGYDWDRSSLKV